MPFWTVEDAGPYKENGNILMRSPHLGGFFLHEKGLYVAKSATRMAKTHKMRRYVWQKRRVGFCLFPFKAIRSGGERYGNFIA